MNYDNEVNKLDEMEKFLEKNKAPDLLWQMVKMLVFTPRGTPNRKTVKMQEH